MTSHLALSALILTYNEELNLEACLSALVPWCPDIHIVDSGSSDLTVEIARRYGVSVHNHPYTDHTSQLIWALAEVPFKSDWMLLVDADNVVTPQLRAKVLRALAKPANDIGGYYAKYAQYFRGKPVRGLKSENLTLFRRSLTTVDPSEVVDFRLIVMGRTSSLDGTLIHSNAKEADVDFWLIKHIDFASRAAREELLRREGRVKWTVEGKLFGTPDERIIWFKAAWYRMPLFVRPFLYFGYRYFIRLGFLDGVNGLVFHVLQAFWYRMVVDLKLSDLSRKLNAGELSLDGVAAELSAGRTQLTGSHRGGLVRTN